MKHITNQCPYCSNIMKVSHMYCKQCDTSIEATFPSSRLANLPSEHQRFIEMFVLAAGNLKEIAKLTGVSYPTVRSRLNKIIDTLREEIGNGVLTEGTLLDAILPFEKQAGQSASQLSIPQTAEQLIKSI